MNLPNNQKAERIAGSLGRKLSASVEISQGINEGNRSFAATAVPSLIG
jgi:hypothetical protein